jgi:predicted DNA-binding transcriptional regulator AlpA
MSATGRPADSVPETPLLTISQACRLVGWSQSKGFDLARKGLFPGQVDLPGHRRVVRRAVLLAVLNGEAPWPTTAPTPLRRVG